MNWYTLIVQLHLVAGFQSEFGTVCILSIILFATSLCASVLDCTNVSVTSQVSPQSNPRNIIKIQISLDTFIEKGKKANDETAENSENVIKKKAEFK